MRKENILNKIKLSRTHINSQLIDTIFVNYHNLNNIANVQFILGGQR